MEAVQRNELYVNKKDIIKVDISYERIDDYMDKAATDKKNNDRTVCKVIILNLTIGITY